MTILQIINRILRRLREDQVTDLTDEYSLLLVEFLSDIHAQVLEAHDWSKFDHTVTVAVAAGTFEYDLSATVSGGGHVTNGETVTTDASILRYDADGRPVVHYYETVSATQGTGLSLISWESYLDLLKEKTDQTSTYPTYFALQQNDSGYKMALWPAPAVTGGYVHLRFNTPEAVVTSSDDSSRVLLAPQRPLIQGVLYLAFNERGEEIGEPGGVAESRFGLALQAAVEQDVMLSGRTNKFEFYRD